MDESHSLSKLTAWIHRNDTETQTASRNLKSSNSTISKCGKSCQSLSTDLDKDLQKLIKKNLWSIGDLSPILILRILFKNLSIKFELLSLYMDNIKKALDEYNKGEKKSSSKSTRKQSKGATQIESARTNLGILLRFFSSTQLNLMDAVIRADLSFLMQMMDENVAVTYLQSFQSKITKIVGQIDSVISSLLSSQNDMMTARDASENNDAFSDEDYDRLVDNLRLYNEVFNRFLSYINGSELSDNEVQNITNALKLTPELHYRDEYEYEDGYYNDNSDEYEEDYYDDDGY